MRSPRYDLLKDKSTEILKLFTVGNGQKHVARKQGSQKIYLIHYENRTSNTNQTV